MMRQAAPESECNQGCMDANGNESPTVMCGGSYRNSIYRTSTTYWEHSGFDDRGWEQAADLGVNGVAPWFHRPVISNAAHWIWTAQPTGHDRVFCRYTKPNGAINCPAAQAAYKQDHPEVPRSNYVTFQGVSYASSAAWQHYQNTGEELGYLWHSELCNYCHLADDSTNFCTSGGGQVCTGNNGADGTGGGVAGRESPYAWETGQVCTDKCQGFHDAASPGHAAHPAVTMIGADISGSHTGHYGDGFADCNTLDCSITFHLSACHAGLHQLGVIYALEADDDLIRVSSAGGTGGPRPMSVTVNGAVATPSLDFPATGAWTEWGRAYVFQ